MGNRSVWPWRSLCLGIGVALCLGAVGAAPGHERVRAFEVIYGIRLDSLPERAQEVRIWVPLAKSDFHQRIRRRVIETNHPYQVTTDPEYGNDILYLALSAPLPRALDLSIAYEAVVRGKPFVSQAVGPRGR